MVTSILVGLLIVVSTGWSATIQLSEPGTVDRKIQHNLLNRITGPERIYNDPIGLLFGWPRQMQGETSLWGRSITVTDIDNNRDWELSIITTEGWLYIYQHDGANYPGFPRNPYYGDRPHRWINPNHRATSAVGDVDGNDLPELVYITDLGYLHVVGETGDEPEPFPIDIGIGNNSGIPALTDLTGDREVEIIFNTFPNHPDSVNATAIMHVYENTGLEMDNWPISYTCGSASSPSVGDIDGDGELEIVIGNARYLDRPAQIWAWSRDGTRVEGFPTGEFETINCAPTLVDLDRDGGLEILIWAADVDHNNIGIYAIRGNGQAFNGFPVDCPAGHPDGSPVAADIDGDDIPEIVFGSYNVNIGGMIYAWNIEGQLLDNFPLRVNRRVVGSLLLADVSDDGVNDIVAALTPSENSSGLIAAWDCSGELIDGFPILLERWGSEAFAGAPTIWDIDDDRDLDLIGVTTDRRLLIWDTHGRLTPDAWLTEKGGMSRTGVRLPNDPSGIKDDNGIAVPRNSMITVHPNPFNRSTLLTIPVPVESLLRVDLFDVHGRRIDSLFSGEVAAGDFELGIDAGKYHLPAGIYLCRWFNNQSFGTVKLLYTP